MPWLRSSIALFCSLEYSDSEGECNSFRFLKLLLFREYLTARLAPIKDPPAAQRNREPTITFLLEDLNEGNMSRLPTW